MSEKSEHPQEGNSPAAYVELTTRWLRSVDHARVPAVVEITASADTILSLRKWDGVEWRTAFIRS